MIRPATYDDVAELVAFAQECQRSMPWWAAGIRSDEDSMIMTMLDLTESRFSDLSVVDLGEGIVGACAVVLGNVPWARDMVIASEWMWHMRPAFPEGFVKRKWIVRMLDHMLDWSRAKDAHVFKANTIHGDMALTALLERRGIRPMETACAGRL